MPQKASASDEKRSESSGRSGVTGATGGIGALTRRLGLKVPPAYRQSRRLIRQSQGMCALARHVSASTRTEEDGAALLRKAIHQLFVAVLRFDGQEATSYDQCRELISSSASYRKLFAPVIDELSFLDEVVQSFDVVLDRRAERGGRYRKLARGMPQQYRAVRRYLEDRARQAGSRPARRRLLVAVALVGITAFVAIPAYRHTKASAEWGSEPLPPASLPTVEPPESNEVLNDQARCFDATYFADQDFHKPVVTRRDCRIDFDWGTAPIPGMDAVPADLFSVRWVGEIEPPASGNYVFYLASDDGSRLFVDGVKVLDNWGNHGPLERPSRIVALTKGKRHAIRVDYYEAGEIAQIKLMWSSDSFDKTVVSGKHIRRAVEGDAGSRSAPSAERSAELDDPTKCFRGQYFEGTEFQRLLHTRRDCVIDFDWLMAGVPGVDDLPVDGFSVRWEGTLRVPQTDEYVFHLGSDDGSRLFVEEQLIVGDWSAHGFGIRDSEPVTLKEGTAYPIRVEFFDESELAAVQLLWSSKAIQREPLSGRYVEPAPLAAQEPVE